MFFRFGRYFISIPFSTIKSLFSRLLLDTKGLFQFHLVRLKVWSGSDATVPETIFQFHLVRLKAPQRCHTAPPCRISIPFSTIKSVTALEGSHSVCEISIPFSTIKSKQPRETEKPLYSISIPFSTIKRLVSILSCRILTHFNSI